MHATWHRNPTRKHPMRLARLASGRLALAVVIGVWCGGCGEQKPPRAFDEMERQAWLESVRAGQRAIATADVLRLYQYHVNQAQRGVHIMVAMGGFDLDMEAVGPQAVPCLVELLDSRHCSHHFILWAIQQIDGAHGTQEYAQMLIGTKISASARSSAIDHLVDNAGRSVVVAQLECLSADRGLSKGQRLRARNVLLRILRRMAEGSPSEAKREWAKEKLERETTRRR